MSRLSGTGTWLRRVLVSGLAAGLVLGVGFRVAMRVVAIMEGLEPEFTVAGTMFILIVGGVFGLIVGPVYGAIRTVLPGSVLVRGAIAGAVLFGLGLLLLGDAEGEARELGVYWVNVLMFGGSFALMGVTLEAAWQWMEHRAVIAIEPGTPSESTPAVVSSAGAS